MRSVYGALRARLAEDMHRISVALKSFEAHAAVSRWIP
jgi:hypothetical protein